MKGKKRKIMIEIDRSLGRKLNIYIESWNNKYRNNKCIGKVTRDNIIQSLLAEKLRDIRELIIDDDGEKRAYYAAISRQDDRAFGNVLYSHSLINFEAENDLTKIDEVFEDVILRYERFVKAEGDSYVIID
jgi:hypothetical protein